MSIINSLKRNKTAIFASILRRCSYMFKDDELYLKLMYLFELHKWPDLKTPKSFNEKLQWLKLYDRRPEYTTMVDKYAAKKYISDIIGEDYIIPTLGIWNEFNEIDFLSLPKQFVLKTTHGGGGNGVVICNDKNKFDRNKAKNILERSLSSDIYVNYREWPYKEVPRRIIAEEDIRQYLSADKDLYDYKFFCFNGVVKFFKIDFGRFVEHHANYYDINGKLLPLGEAAFPPVPSAAIKIPDTLNTMITLAEKISHDCLFLRVDFYTIGEKIYFGETTFYPASGFGKIIPDSWDDKIGSLLKLPFEQ